MSERLFDTRSPLPEQSFGAPPRVRRAYEHFLPFKVFPKLNGIRSKLTLLVVGLITLLTLGTSFLVINVMDDVLLHSMIKRGAASAYAIAASAGYSILAEDRLALDNLVAQGKQAQKDLSFVAILDTKRVILAHSRFELTGSQLPHIDGELIERDGKLRAVRVLRNGQPGFEFSLPIDFAKHRVGEVVVSLNPQSLLAARSVAHWRILFITGLTILCGIAGALFLTRLFTRPITQLSQGVEHLKAGHGKVRVPVLADDELGDLTRNFNAMAAEIAAQREGLIESSATIEKSYHDIVRILAGALDARDNYTYGHSARVARLAIKLGEQLGLNSKQLEELEMSCLLHDIGKIRVPDSILNKQAPLDSQENSRIQDHPLHGVELLALADSLHRYIPNVKHHHEWYNGKGYPDGLRNTQIPIGAQIVAIADAYDAMTTSRPYREGLPHETAITEIQRQRGSQFDPQLVDLFLATLQEPHDEFLHTREYQ